MINYENNYVVNEFSLVMPSWSPTCPQNSMPTRFKKSIEKYVLACVTLLTYITESLLIFYLVFYCVHQQTMKKSTRWLTLTLYNFIFSDLSVFRSKKGPNELLGQVEDPVTL
jgi:hypothetical protein